MLTPESPTGAHRRGSVQLPPGVKDPGTLIKDMGPIRVEPKVWLANQRTFIKWQHISVLLASLSLGLFNAAGESNNVARGLGVVYTLVGLFAGAWGWWVYIVRSRMIQERSGKDFDNIIGPITVCAGLTLALCVNFGFKVNRPSMAMRFVNRFSIKQPRKTGKPMRISIRAVSWIASRFLSRHAVNGCAMDIGRRFKITDEQHAYVPSASVSHNADPVPGLDPRHSPSSTLTPQPIQGS